MNETNPTPTQQGETLLEHCPFCPHGYGFIRNESGRYNGVVWVECDWPSHAVRLVAGNDAVPPCGAKTAEYQTEQEAITAWNTRAAVAGPRGDAWQNLLDAACERVAAKKQYDNDPAVTSMRCGKADEWLWAAVEAIAAATASPAPVEGDQSNQTVKINHTKES